MSFFKHNQSLTHKDMTKTDFLRLVTHQMRFSREKGLFDEVIRTSNVLDGLLVIWQLSDEERTEGLLCRVDQKIMIEQIGLPTRSSSVR